MANIFNYLFTQKKVTINDGGGNLLEIDATISESHGLSAQATMHEIEDGLNISDHIIKGDIILNIAGIVSDDPISLTSTLIGVGGGSVGSLVGGKAGAITTGIVGKLGNTILNRLQGKPSKDAHDIFCSIYENKLLCTIVTGLAVYENMVMEDYQAPRSYKTQRSLEFSAKFKKIRIVTSKTVEIQASEKEAGGVANSDTSKKSIGKQEAEATTPAISSKGSSILYRMIN